MQRDKCFSVILSLPEPKGIKRKANTCTVGLEHMQATIIQQVTEGR